MKRIPAFFPRMKGLSAILFLFLFLFHSRSISAQDQSYDTLLARRFLLDFAVPDQPAFNLLGSTPSTLLRPSGKELVSVITSNFFSGRTAIIPQDFGLEISPVLLIGYDNITLHDYGTGKRFLYDSRISVGTSRTPVNGSNSVSNLSFGLRTTLWDNSDLVRMMYLEPTRITRNSRREQVMRVQEEARKVYAELQEEVNRDADIKLLVVDNLSKESPDTDWRRYSISDIRRKQLIDKSSLTAGEKKFLAEWEEAEAIMEDERAYRVRRLRKAEQSFEERFENENWNRSKGELAVAVMGTARDSLFTHLDRWRVGVWFTGTFGCSRSGELLTGFNYQSYSRDSLLPDSTSQRNTYMSIAIPLRYYMGTNDYKGFAEIQGRYFNDPVSTISFMANLGAEFHIRQGFWAEVYAGIEGRKAESDTQFRWTPRGNVAVKFKL